MQFLHSEAGGRAWPRQQRSKPAPHALPWLRRNAIATPVHAVDFVFTPDLQPIAPHGSPRMVGLLPPGIGVDGIDGMLHLPGFPEPEPILPPSPVQPGVVPSRALCIPPNPLLAARGCTRS